MSRFAWKSREDLDTEARDAKLAELRARRDRALAASDWTQLPDAPITAAERTAWAQHRQELRDLPDQAKEDPDAAQLPDPPSPARRRGPT